MTQVDAGAATPVPLPPIDGDLLEKTQVHGAIWGDSRRFPRFAANTGPCLLESEGTYERAGRPRIAQWALLRDLSRGGTRFLHGAQIFPGERYTITLPTGPCMRLEAVWCRRMAAGVYMTGCRFVRSEARSEEKQEG